MKKLIIISLILFSCKKPKITIEITNAGDIFSATLNNKKKYNDIKELKIEVKDKDKFKLSDTCAIRLYEDDTHVNSEFADEFMYNYPYELILLD